MRKKSIVRLNTTLLALMVLVLFGCKEKKPEVTAKQQVEYTCPMHPQIIRKEPGKCPICGMDLVPKQAAGEDGVDTGLANLLKPVNEQVVARIPVIRPESGTRIFSREIQGNISYDTRRQTSIASRVSGRIEKIYIKYNYQQIRKGQLIMEIYSPDLAAAQRELLYLVRTQAGVSLIDKAQQRLTLLGMSSAQVQNVISTGTISYRVPVYSTASGYILEKNISNAGSQTGSDGAAVSAQAAGSGGDNMSGGMASGGSMSGGASGTGSVSQLPAQNSPVLIREGQYVAAGQSLFAVYSNTSLVAEFALTPALAAEVKRGQKLVFRKIADPGAVYTGSIGLIQPTFRAGQNFTLARVYLLDSRFRIGELISANIPIVSRGWWVPSAAVLQLGTRAVVFRKQGNVFIPTEVKTGISAEGMIQLFSEASDWLIAENAAYLVDSESFIRLTSSNAL